MSSDRPLGPGPRTRIPLTVLGGYLGAGKTTVLNRLLTNPGGRRIGVVVNDFGSVGIDAEWLARTRDDGVVNLPNGCACCTLGDDLHQALGRLAADPGLDHVMVEVSGVADPAAVAAWSTVEPFEPGGVIVLAAADSIRALATDRYVGGEVVRQLTGADLVVVTKVDRCDGATIDAVEAWLDRIVPTVPRVRAVRGDLPPDLLVGTSPTHSSGELRIVAAGHTDRYETWAWNTGHPLDRARLAELLDALPAGVLRLKGWVLLSDGDTVDVNVVGRSREITRTAAPPPEGRASALVAIGVRGTADPFATGSIALQV